MPATEMKGKIVVGHATLPVTYRPGDTAFHVKDVPPAARQARIEAKKSKKPRILGDFKPEWSGPLTMGERLCYRDGHLLHDHDRNTFHHNFRAEKLPTPQPVKSDVFGKPGELGMKTIPRLKEIPNHPDLDSKPLWNTSTVSTTEKTLKKALAKQTVRSKRATSRVTDFLDGYVSPEAMERDRMKTLRKEREDRASAPILSTGEAVVAPKQKGPKLRLTSTVTRRFKHHKHSGIYGETPFEKSKAWSCCMSSDPDAPGCIVSSMNPDAYNFASIN